MIKRFQSCQKTCILYTTTQSEFTEQLKTSARAGFRSCPYCGLDLVNLPAGWRCAPCNWAVAFSADGIWGARVEQHAYHSKQLLDAGVQFTNLSELLNKISLLNSIKNTSK